MPLRLAVREQRPSRPREFLGALHPGHDVLHDARKPWARDGALYEGTGQPWYGEAGHQLQGQEQQRNAEHDRNARGIDRQRVRRGEDEHQCAESPVAHRVANVSDRDGFARRVVGDVGQDRR
jgi:hypothetical protein